MHELYENGMFDLRYELKFAYAVFLNHGSFEKLDKNAKQRFIQIR